MTRTVTTVALTTLTLLSTRAHAATFTVTNTNNTGPGSLRQAIADASASGSNHVVVFAPGTTGTITLASSISTSSPNLSIIGPGARLLTIKGGFGAPHLIFGSSNTVIGLTFQGATRSAIELSGGGTAVVQNCAFLSNTNATSGGGAIVNSAGGFSLNVINCLFASNAAPARTGGAISLGADSGALSVTNTTFVSNSAGFGGAIGTGSNAQVMLTSCTIVNNAATTFIGAVFASPIALTNCIVTNNTAPSDPDLASTAMRTSTGSNYLSPSIGALASGDIVGSAPLLGPLQNNGGDTDTLAPLPGSPVIDKGIFVASAPGDQRGVARPFNFTGISPNTSAGSNNSDIGAVELSVAPCIADANSDGLVSVNDIFAFLAVWFARCQ